MGLSFQTDLSDFPVASPVLLFSIPYRVLPYISRVLMLWSLLSQPLEAELSYQKASPLLQ